MTWTTAPSPTQLVNGTSYTFRVRAVTTTGNGASSQVNATPSTWPPRPSFSGHTPGIGNVALRWDAQNTAATNGGAPILRFQIERSVAFGAWAFTGETTGSATTFTSTGLGSGHNVRFRISSENLNGWSDWSTELSVNL